MYNDGGQYWDEHAFAAAWLYAATNERKYLVSVARKRVHVHMYVGLFALFV